MKTSKIAAAAMIGICLMLVFGAGSKAASKGYTNQDLKILSCIIFTEAGNQGYSGKLAVANVVLNRRKSSAFPNTIKGVVYQRNQFAPVRSGKLRSELKRYQRGSYKHGARGKCMKAAKAALEGKNYITSRGKKITLKKFRFFNRHLSRARLRIGAHDFK